MDRNIVIRVDSGKEIGWGHMMRCFSLAETLRSKNVKVSFISKKLPGSLCKFIKENKFEVHHLPKGLENDAEKTIKIIDRLNASEGIIGAPWAPISHRP